MTTTPIDADNLHEAVGKELSGLLALGFTEHQARTMIVSALILASNRSKAQAPAPAEPAVPTYTNLRDSDGDYWVRVEGEDDLWHCPAEDHIRAGSREDVDRRFGPLTEVYA